jgi:hypothetical protein
MPDQMEFTWTPDFHSAALAAKETPCLPVPRPAAPAPSPLAARRAELQRQANALLDDLGKRTSMVIRLRITDNSSTIMSVRHTADGKGARVSLHHMFLAATDEVRAALAHWIKHPKSRASGSLLDEFMREQRHLIQPRKRPAHTLRTRGHCFDLGAIYRELNQRFFENTVSAKITWGKMPTVNRRRSIRFGSHEPKAGIIRIHPLLDQPFVPEFFVTYIVYHEMLHAFLGIEELPSGRRGIHTPKFRRVEKAYPDYQRALDWMENKNNLNRLLRRTLEPPRPGPR